MNILELIAQSAKNKEVTAYQVIEAYNQGSGEKYKIEVQTRHFGLTNILGSIGSLFVFIGIAIYISFYWNELNNISQLILSIGLGLVLFYITLFLNRVKPKNFVSDIMVPVSFLWLNWGMYQTVFLSIFSSDIKEWLYILALAILALVYYLAFDYLKNSLFFTCFNLMYFITLLGLMDKILKIYSHDFNTNYFYVGIITVGISGLFIHYNFYEVINKWVRSLNLFSYYGILLLGFVTLFNHWNSNNDKLPSPNAIIELLTSLVIAGWYFIAIKTRSSLLVVTNSIGLYFWLTYIYGKFFNSFDFGITLILAGFVLLGIAYFTWKLKNQIDKKI